MSTNIDSKDINNLQNQNLKESKTNNNNIYYSNEMSKNIENMMNKLDSASKTMLNMNQRMNFLETQLNNLYNLPKNEFNSNTQLEQYNNNNGNEEEYANPEALKEAMDYYHSMIQKNNDNDNPVEIFEDANNHVEDIKQEVMNNKNLNRNEIIDIYSHNNNNIDNINSNTSPVE